MDSAYERLLFLQIKVTICINNLHRDVHVRVYSVVCRSGHAEYACVLFYAALAVNGKMRGVEMNFDL